MAATFIMAVAVIPLLVAVVGYQSGQAMFWPALGSLYTYFLPYTLVACLVATMLMEGVRLIVKRVKGSGAQGATGTRRG